MQTVTDAEYHLAFGLHSGVPLCCAIEFTDGGQGGPCPACKEKGVSSKEMFSQMHTCHENNPACVPYLDIIERRAFQWFREHRDRHPINLVEGEQDDFTWGTNLFAPMGEEFRDALNDSGYRMVHLCWPSTSRVPPAPRAQQPHSPEPSVYWYIFQQPGGLKGTCGICSTKFSLKFPTTGKRSK